MLLILVVDVEAVSVREDRVAYVSLSWQEELGVSILARAPEVVLLAGRAAGGRDEDELACLRLTDTAGEASIELLI